MNILYRHSAFIDLQQAYEWGRFKFGAKYGKRFVATLRAQVRRLAGHPELGIIDEQYSDSTIEVRTLVIHESFKARYYYDQGTDTIIIVRILDVRRIEQ